MNSVNNRSRPEGAAHQCLVTGVANRSTDPVLADRFRVPDVVPLPHNDPIKLHKYTRQCPSSGKTYPHRSVANLFFGAQIDPYSAHLKVTLRQREPDKLDPPL